MFVAHSDLTHLKINNMLAKSEKRNMNFFPCRDIVLSGNVLIQQHLINIVRLSQVCPMSCMIGELSCGDLNTRTVSCTLVCDLYMCTCVTCTLSRHSLQYHSHTISSHQRPPLSDTNLNHLTSYTSRHTFFNYTGNITMYKYFYLYLYSNGAEGSWLSNIHEDFYDLNCRLKGFLLSIVLSVPIQCQLPLLATGTILLFVSCIFNLLMQFCSFSANSHVQGEVGCKNWCWGF